MQTMRDQPACACQKLAIFIAKSVQFIALGIEHTEDVAVAISHGHNDLRARGVECGQITHVLVHVAHDDRLARFQRRAAQPLCNGKTRIRGRLACRFRP